MADGLLDSARAAVDIALKAGASDAIASVGDSNSTSFDFRDGKLEKVQQSASRSLGISLYVNGRYSAHNTTDLRPNELRRFIGDAIELTKHLEPDPFRVIPDPSLYANRPSADLDLVDPSVETLERERCIEWLKEMDEAVHADPKVISATSSVRQSHGESARFSSNGFEGTSAQSSAGWGSSVTLNEGDGRRPEGGYGVRGRYVDTLPRPVEAARTALQRALARLGSSKAPSARTTLVIAPEEGSNIIGRFLGALSAGSVQQRRSFLADKLGQRVGSERLNITDDPLIKRGLGSRHYDGEGISAHAMPLFENGMLRNFYIDTYYGKKLNWKPTSGGSSNLSFKLGDKNLEQLISDAGSGFYVDGWLGGNCDGTTGDFSLGIRGHKIENGRLGAPIGEMNITGNLLELMSNLAAVGNDPYPYSSYYTPTLVFTNVQFSGQ